MIFIPPNKPGALWLRAMFKQRCRQYNCGVVWYPTGRAEAIGEEAKQAEYKFEMDCAALHNKIIDALASPDATGAASTIITRTTREFVKQIYKEAAASVQGD